MSNIELRVPILKRIAEQAMSDADFRRAAAVDLDGALKNWGYELNSLELELVHQFRETLAEAGIDLMLAKNIDMESIFDDVSTADLQNMIRGQQSS